MTTIVDGTTGITFPSAISGVSATQQYSGRVLQVVHQTYNTKTSTTTDAWSDIFSASITPTSTSSKVLVSVTLSGSHVDNYSGLIRVTRAGTAIGGGSGTSPYEPNTWFNLRTTSVYFVMTFSNSFLDSPGTNSSTTYAVQFRAPGGAAFYINRTMNDGGSAAYDSPVASSITLTEIAA